MRKLFDVLAAIAGIGCLLSGCALDTPSNLPLEIFAVCIAYLSIYTYINIKLGNCIDLDRGDTCDLDR